MSIKNKVRKTFIYNALRAKIKYRYRPNRERIKNVMITGVAYGLGRLLALQYATNGYKVIGLDIEKHQNIDNELKSLLDDYIEFDLRKIDRIDEMIGDIYQKHGSIDLIINNAGILNFKAIYDYRVDEITDMVTVNLISVMVLIRSILPRMVSNKFGRIINISSKAGFQSEDKFGLYSPTKAGVMLLSDSVAKLINNEHWQVSVTINSINPDRINTPEFIADNPGVNPRNLIQSDRVYKKIQRIVSSEVNGETFPIFSFWKKLSYLLQFFQKLFL